MVGASEWRVIKKQKWDPWRGSTLIIKTIRGESRLFFTVVCVNVFSYHMMSFFRILKLRTSPFY